MKQIFTFLALGFLSASIFSNETEEAKTDILFLKIQELEQEIAELRNEIESQNFLIEKLINETSLIEDQSLTNLALTNDSLFQGIEDLKSKVQVYTAAINALENQDYENAFKLFSYFVESFKDEDKTPLAFFWLGEISFIENDLDSSQKFFMELISAYPDHYRTPLAHKKIGDIYLKSGDIKNAKVKYNYVVREYPNNTASSLALQLLKNME